MRRIFRTSKTLIVGQGPLVKAQASNIGSMMQIPGSTAMPSEMRAFSSVESAPSDFERNLLELEERGFTIVKDVFSQEEIAQMQGDYEGIRDRALDMIENTQPKPRVWMENGKVTKSQYWKGEDGAIILQAGEGRYDLWKNFQQGFFASKSVVQNKKIEELCKVLMIDDYKNYSGVIMSKPGSQHQYYHRDTDNLTNRGSDGKALMQVDDFYFTTLIPISVDTTPENGPTEFFVGSHRKSADQFDSLELAQVCCKVCTLDFGRLRLYSITIYVL